MAGQKQAAATSLSLMAIDSFTLLLFIECMHKLAIDPGRNPICCSNERKIYDSRGILCLLSQIGGISVI